MNNVIEIGKKDSTGNPGKKTLRIHRDCILVKRDGAAKVLNVSKIQLTKEGEMKHRGLAHYGTILQVGPQVSPDHKVGDYVVYAKYAGLEIPVNENATDEVLISESDILVTVVQEDSGGEAA